MDNQAAAAAAVVVDNGRHGNDDDVTGDEQQQQSGGYVEVRSTRRDRGHADGSTSGPAMTSRRRPYEDALYASIDHRIAGHTYVLVVDD